MKKIMPSSGIVAAVMSLFLMIFILEGCSGANEAMEIKSAMGTIIVVGNEPFTNPALQIAEDEIYVIDCTKEERQQFYDNQGKAYKIYYNVIMDGPAGKTMNMVKFEKLEN